MDKPQMTKLDPPERMRTYYFTGQDIVLHDVTAVCVRPSGSHRVETADGRKWIIQPGWLAIELDVNDWTF